MEIRILPIPDDFLHQVRETGVDALGQPVRRMTARGGEPLRDVLRGAHEGEALLLGSFSPFRKQGPYREFGPIFIRASDADEPVERTAFPQPEGTPADYFGRLLVLRAYDEEETIRGGKLIAPVDAPAALEELLARPDVVFVDARYVVHGCFACRFVRA